MLNLFRKQTSSKERHSNSSFLSYELQPVSKVVDSNGVSQAQVSFVKVHMSAKANKADIPLPENYELREMIKQGYLPNEVSVNGILDNIDEQDTKVLAALDLVGEKLSNVEPDK